jgi:beta-galactosidase
VIPFAFSGRKEKDRVFSHQFTAPPQWEGKQLFLRLHGITPSYLVKINGFNYGSGHSGGYPSEYHITPFLKPGTNQIELLFGGSSEPVIFHVDDPGALILRDPVHVRDIQIHTFPGPDSSHTGVRIHLHIQSYLMEKNKGRDLILKLRDPEGSMLFTRTEELSFPLAFRQETEIIFDQILENPRLWSPGHPQLYSVELHMVEKGKSKGEEIFTQFGIRDAVFQDSLLLINGDSLVPQFAAPPLIDQMLRSPDEIHELSGKAKIQAIHASRYLPPVVLNQCDRHGLIVTVPVDKLTDSQLKAYSNRPSVVWIK